MDSRIFWITTARRLALRRNLAHWLEGFLPMALALAAAGAACLLLLRTWKIETAPLWYTLSGALLLAVVASWFFARRRFLKPADALVRLEEVGRLHNRLTAARAGIGAWPARQHLRDRTRWNWPRLLGPIALAVILLVGATWLPVPQSASAKRPIEPPLAWTQVESWLQTIEAANLVEPEALEKLHAQLDELARQSPDHWYDQSSLEAGDTLREQTEQALRAMSRDLQKSEETLAAAGKAGESKSPNELKALNDALQKSLHGLEIGTLPLNKEMLANLKKFDASKLVQLSADQLTDLKEKLKAGTRVCEKCIGPTKGERRMFGENEPGGEGGGGGPAPLALKEEATNLRTKHTEPVSNEDLSHVAPGDLVGLNKGEHDVKEIVTGPVAGGAISSNGEGGDAVWRDSLTPQEREVLQRYFK